MGRLTDDLMAILGLKPSDRVTSGHAAKSSQQLPTGESMPAEPDVDCVSCKVIGTTVLVAGSCIPVYMARKSRHSFSGFRRVALYVQTFSISTALLTLAYCRAFNVGIFDRSGANDPSKPKKTLVSEAKNDMKYLVLSLGYDLPTFLQDSNENLASDDEPKPIDDGKK